MFFFLIIAIKSKPEKPGTRRKILPTFKKENQKSSVKSFTLYTPFLWERMLDQERGQHHREGMQEIGELPQREEVPPSREEVPPRMLVKEIRTRHLERGRRQHIWRALLGRSLDRMPMSPNTNDDMDEWGAV